MTGIILLACAVGLIWWIYVIWWMGSVLKELRKLSESPAESATRAGRHERLWGHAGVQPDLIAGVKSEADSEAAAKELFPEAPRYDAKTGILLKK